MNKLKRRPINKNYFRDIMQVVTEELRCIRCNTISPVKRHYLLGHGKIIPSKFYTTHTYRQRNEDYKGPPHDHMCLYKIEVGMLKRLRKKTRRSIKMKEHAQFPGHYRVTEADRKAILAKRDSRRKVLPYKIQAKEKRNLFQTDYSNQGSDPKRPFSFRLKHTYNPKTDTILLTRVIEGE